MTYYVGHLGSGLGHAQKSREGLGSQTPPPLINMKIKEVLLVKKHYVK